MEELSDRGAPAPQELEPLAALDALGIEYVRLTHPAAATMELCQGVGAEFEARHCKNLFLANRSGSAFILLLMDADKPYRTSEVSRRLGVSRQSFGTAEQLKNVLGLEPGAVSVMGLVTENAKQAYRERRLRVALDSDLLKRERICVHPNVNTATLVISTRDLIGFLERSGFEYSVIEV